ncbi:olfactory receptor 1009-like [Bombina bombina]|uniref:olfactory receptor 1009-like n=1 Tax=Bombina bombina TaxID=8345 RepID=UPI00235AF366|nr:olfactory receptor 1009-like [Bombina bombina]
MSNYTNFKEFILLGLTDNPALELFLFVLFLIFYTITIFANIGIIVIIRADARLHTPMYFFLNNLSFLDLCYATIITPKTLVNFLSNKKVIAYVECILQMYLFGASVTIECFLLGIMAYDRYVAICNPLVYLTIMNKRFCLQLVGYAYIGGYLNAAIHTTCTFQLPFCKSNKIDHFYCDVPPLLKLSCVDTTMNELVMFIFGGFAEISSLTAVTVSYAYIISTIMRIHSNEGRKKAFSTCASHLTAVIIFYGTIVFMYLRPSSTYSLSQDRIASVFYTVVIPMLNPLIYSLRNKEVARASEASVCSEKSGVIRTNCCMNACSASGDYLAIPGDFASVRSVKGLAIVANLEINLL